MSKTTKRLSSAIQSSDEETVIPSSSPNVSDDEQPNVKKAKKTKSPTKSPTKGDQPRRVWTTDEDKIFFEVIEKLVGGGLWQAIKEDGRLEYRGNPGIKAHSNALFKNLKRNGMSGGEK